jgi:O-antigen/teichoic acid export membrane protein
MEVEKKIYDFLKWSERYTGTDMVYLAKGGFWLILGNVLSILPSLAIMIVFGRFVSKEIYGAYQYILSIATILAIFALPGIDTALIRIVARGHEKMIIPCFKEKIKWGTIGSLISFFIALWYFLHQNFNLGFSFLIVAVFLPFINAFLLYSSFWQGKKRFDIQNKYYISHNFLAAFLLIPVIFLTKNLILIVLAYFFAFTLAEAIFYKLTIKGVSNDEEEKETISFGKHLTLMQTAAVFAGQINNIILWQLLGPASLAIYSFAEGTALKFQGLVPISALALPKLSQRKVGEIKRGLFKKFLKLFLLSFLLTFIYILICPYIFKIFFPIYLDSIPYSQILALLLIFTPFSLLGTSLLAEMRKRELYILNFATPILKTILFLILIPLYGIWGVIFSILIAQVFNSGLTLYFFRKI